MQWSGVSQSLLRRGLVSLVAAAAIHGAAVAVCVEAAVLFRDGQVRERLYKGFRQVKQIVLIGYTVGCSLVVLLFGMPVLFLPGPVGACFFFPRSSARNKGHGFHPLSMAMLRATHARPRRGCVMHYDESVGEAFRIAFPWCRASRFALSLSNALNPVTDCSFFTYVA